MENVRKAVAAKLWDAGHRLCREAMLLAAKAGQSEVLRELEELEEQCLSGKVKNQGKSAIADLLQKAKASLEAGNFEVARAVLDESQWAAKHLCLDEEINELQTLLQQVETGKRQAAFRRDGALALKKGQVFSYGQSKVTFFVDQSPGNIP